MIKITCTEEKKKKLIEIFDASDYCIFADRPCYSHFDCKTCVETNIQWEILKNNNE